MECSEVLRMAQKRWKRKSGYVTSDLTIPKKELIEGLCVNLFYDDWNDWRDGLRDWFRDFKLIKKINSQQHKYAGEELLTKRVRMNKKQERLLKRRRARK